MKASMNLHFNTVVFKRTWMKRIQKTNRENRRRKQRKTTKTLYKLHFSGATQTMVGKLIFQLIIIEIYYLLKFGIHLKNKATKK